MCVKLLGDIMDLLYVADTGSTFRDVTEIMFTIMRTVIQTTIAMDREGPLVVSNYLHVINGTLNVTLEFLIP